MTRRSRFLILLIFLVIFLVVIPILALLNSFRTIPYTGLDKVAVVVDIRGEVSEYQPYFSPEMLLGKRELTLNRILSVIGRAADDTRVMGMVLRIYPSGAGIAKCEEMRKAIHLFKETGKTVVAFSPLLVNHHYLLACAADSVFMPPSGYLMISGPASSAVFVRGTLDKLGVRSNIHKIGEYKTAAEMFTEKERTPASKEMTEWVLEDVFERFASTIAEERAQETDRVRMNIDRGLFSPRRAMESGLIDGIRYFDQIRASFENAGAKLVTSGEYLRTASMYSAGSAPGVAVIHAQGTIVMGESGFDIAVGPTMGSETIIRELRRAQRDKRIEAVILRIDSPGGDGLAGEMVSREVEITSRKKPVVVSMSDVAASGGYEIAYRADRIVALPGTITGSIGSITGKFNMRGFYDKIGITKDETGVGEKALIYSDYRDFSDSEWEVLKEEHWEFYWNWIGDIARCRAMAVGEVDSLARGRVWTGSQAAELGLIDEVGGFERALELACELSGIEDPSRVRLVHLPKRLGLLQSILSGGFLESTAAYLVHSAVYRNPSYARGLFLWHRL